MILRNQDIQTRNTSSYSSNSDVSNHTETQGHSSQNLNDQPTNFLPTSPSEITTSSGVANDQLLDSLNIFPPHMAQSIIATIQPLREAHDSASKFGRESWDFAIELSQLVDAGISTHVLRLLVCKNWIAHKRETTSGSENRRTFEPETDLVFSDRTCFVITKLGYQFVSNLTSQQLSQLLTNPKDRFMSTHHTEPNNEGQSVNQVPVHKEHHQQQQAPSPVWDRTKRELRIGDRVVKQFKWPAENQERVLDAFESKGWPSRIDDPLLPHPDICPKRRLHDTLKCLNRKQANELIKFRGDGTGLGVLLELNLDNSENK